MLLEIETFDFQKKYEYEKNVWYEIVILRRYTTLLQSTFWPDS